jgi:hypothetical protein
MVSITNALPIKEAGLDDRYSSDLVLCRSTGFQSICGLGQDGGANTGIVGFLTH